MIELLFISLILFFILAFYLKFMKNTVFGMSLQKGHYPGFFFFYEFIVFIVPSSVLLNIYPIEDFWVAFKVKQEMVFSTTLIILLSYSLMVFILFLIARAAPKYFRYEKPVLSSSDINTYQKFVVFSVVFSLLLIVVAWLFFGTGHSFIKSFSLGQSISQARLELTDSALTKFLKYYFIIISPLLAAIIASPVFKDNRWSRMLLLFSVILMASWGGSKGPLLSLFIIYFITSATFSNYKLRAKSFFIGVALLFLLMFLVYQVVLLQYPHLKDVTLFLDYFLQRVFVAQMIGIYEQFSLNIHNTLYFLHGIPFASFFIDFPVFQKDLMMISEDRVDPSTIGIKNTYFVAEAYAMGGWFFILPAVFIYAINFALSYLMVLFVFNKFLVRNLSFNKVIVAIFLFSYLGVTGGFSDILLFKVMIMLFILMSPVFLIGYFSRFKIKMN
ncbi:hypothetical protein [Shewanella chilikensis]|uniref:hypothetical protein n=1 Tax=Shewanella TaxID=22 RepID=UPI00399C0E75